jgi:hypothetical protein
LAAVLISNGGRGRGGACGNSSPQEKEKTVGQTRISHSSKRPRRRVGAGESPPARRRLRAGAWRWIVRVDPGVASRPSASLLYKPLRGSGAEHGRVTRLAGAEQCGTAGYGARLCAKHQSQQGPWGKAAFGSRRGRAGGWVWSAAPPGRAPSGMSKVESKPPGALTRRSRGDQGTLRTRRPDRRASAY